MYRFHYHVAIIVLHLMGTVKAYLLSCYHLMRIQMTYANTSDPTTQRLSFSHIGFFVHDLDRMAGFYRDVIGMTETDRGALEGAQLVFLSTDPAEHHQIALVTGRPTNMGFNCINQISFRVPDLAALREVRRRVAVDPDVSNLECATHGNALSIYFQDPEGNRVEIFFDTPWYCEQPIREPIDLECDDGDIMARVEELARSRPGFQSRAMWQRQMAKRMGLA